MEEGANTKPHIGEEGKHQKERKERNGARRKGPP